MKYLTPFKLLFREFHGYKIEILILFLQILGENLKVGALPLGYAHEVS